MLPGPPTELYIQARPASLEAVELACRVASTDPLNNTVAVAVAPSNVGQAVDLLFGTGLGVVSVLGNGNPSDLLTAARLSMATGASEIALPPRVVEDPTVISDLKSWLGSSIPLTVDVTSPRGVADLDLALQAFGNGAEFVSFAPGPASVNPLGQLEGLVAVADELDGDVKLTLAPDHDMLIAANLASRQRVAIPFRNRSGRFGNSDGSEASSTPLR